MTPTRVSVRSWACSLWAGALGGALLGLVGGTTLITAISEVQPVTIREAREVDGVAFRGGHLDLLFTIDRVRVCSAVTSRYLWRWTKVDGRSVRQLVPLETSFNGVTSVGTDQHSMLSLALPRDLPEGDWFSWSRSTAQCPSLLGFSHSIIYQTPNVPVRIIKHPDEAEAPRL